MTCRVENVDMFGVVYISRHLKENPKVSDIIAKHDMLEERYNATGRYRLRSRYYGDRGQNMELNLTYTGT